MLATRMRTANDYTQYDSSTLFRAAISPTSTPDERIASAREYAARAAVDKSLVSVSIDGNLFNTPDRFIDAAKNSTGEVKTALYAAAMVIATGTNFEQATKNALDSDGMLELARQYITDNPLRTVKPPKTQAPAPVKEEKIEKEQKSGPAPEKSYEGQSGGSYDVGAGDVRQIGQGPWIPLEKLRDSFFEDPNFRFSSFMQNYLNGDSNAANALMNQVLAKAYRDYYQRESGGPVDSAADKRLGEALLKLLKKDYFDIYFNGQGDKARRLLEDGNLSEFFAMVANDLGNPLAADLLNKDAQADVSTGRTYLLGVFDIYIEGGDILAKIRHGQSFAFPWLFFSDASARVEMYGKDLETTRYGLTSDLAHPIQPVAKASVEGLKWYRQSVAGTWALDFPEFISFFVETRLYHSHVPERLKIVDVDTKRTKTEYGDYGGMSIRISKANTLTGTNRHEDVFFGADLSKSPVLPDWDLGYFKQADQAGLYYANLNLKSAIPVGSYVAIYLQGGAEMQYSKDNIASNKIVFIPRAQINFDKQGRGRVVVGGQAAYDLGTKKPQYGVEANLFVPEPLSFIDLLLLRGQLNYVKENWPYQNTAQVTVGITFK